MPNRPLLTYAATGHRPEKLGDNDDFVFSRLCDLAYAFLDRELLEYDLRLIVGMSRGWDMAVGFVASALDIPYIAAVPFRGQDQGWSKSDRQLYFDLLIKAESIVYVCEPGCQGWKYQRRNEWMVDHCDRVVALYDSGKKSGTKNCIDYAEKQGKTVVNLWGSWVKYAGVQREVLNPRSA